MFPAFPELWLFLLPSLEDRFLVPASMMAGLDFSSFSTVLPESIPLSRVSDFLPFCWTSWLDFSLTKSGAVRRILGSSRW